MAFSTTAENEALDGITADFISLHSGDPGSTGANLISAVDTAKMAAVFNAAAASERVLNADVTFTGGTPSDPVTHFGAWEGDSPGVFKFGSALTGDQAFNAAGEYTVKSGDTKMTAAG